MKKDELIDWLDKYDIVIKNEKELSNGTLFNLEKCPFSEDHEDGAYIICMNNGVVVAKCHHESCKDASWAKLYEMKTGEKLKSKKSNKRSDCPSISGAIDNMIKDNKLEAFSDEYGIPYVNIASVENEDSLVTLPVRTYEFRMHMQNLLKQYMGEILSKKDFEMVTDYVGMLAFKSGEKIHLYRRICNSDNQRILYELNKDDNKCIEIKDGKCNVINTPSRCFQHNKSFRNQVNPDFTGKNDKVVWLLKKHCNFKKESDAQLFAIYIVTCFLGVHINHPILMVHGEKGSAKSTLLRRFESIVDPKNIDLCSIPKTEDSMSIRLSNNYVNCFDNLSYLKHDVSDLLCRCATGGTNVRRTLYENSDETIFNLKSVVLLNGVDAVVTESDLLDRTLIIELDKIKPDELKTEHDLNSSFQDDLPVIVGTCMNIVAVAMQDKEEVSLKNKVRMADFFEWAVKIGRVMGYKDETVANLLVKNQKTVNEQAIYENTVAQALIILMEHKKTLTESVTDLLGKLKKVAADNNIDTATSFPKQPNALSRKLNQIRSNLEEYGITYEVKNVGSHKQITLNNSKSHASPVRVNS